MCKGGIKAGELNIMTGSMNSGNSKLKEYILEKRVDELESSIKNLLKYFTSGNDIEVEKVTLTLNQIKSEFGHLFPDHKFTQ